MVMGGFPFFFSFFNSLKWAFVVPLSVSPLFSYHHNNTLGVSWFSHWNLDEWSSSKDLPGLSFPFSTLHFKLSCEYFPRQKALLSSYTRLRSRIGLWGKCYYAPFDTTHYFSSDVTFTNIVVRSTGLSSAETKVRSANCARTLVLQAHCPLETIASVDASHYRNTKGRSCRSYNYILCCR